MRIDIQGRNVEITEELRDAVTSRFKRVGRQLSDEASLEIVLTEERNPAISDGECAEATLYMKGATLHARECAPEMLHAIHELAEDIRRQVKKKRDKRRARSKARRLGRALRDSTA
jgi:putative sigma-54 modulation protein